LQGLTDYQRFERRVAIVTGGARGIGRAVARALAAEGANVVIVARSESQCHEAADEIGALAVPADVRDSSACRRVVDAAAERWSPPSILVNAAGISPSWVRAEDQDPSVFREIIDTNVVGAFAMSRAAAGGLLERGGAIVNIASVLGVIGSPRLAGYGASKAALIHLTRTLAREWANRNVRVNAVCPAYVETDMTSGLLAVDSRRETILRATPLGRLATLEEIVAPVLFLASDEATYITGASLQVDGGMGT